MNVRNHENQPMVMPGGLVFLAAMWLVGSCIVSLGVRVPVHASSASYEPGVRMLLICVGVGWVIGWPMFRLSQSAQRRPLAHTMLDCMVMLALLQLAIWLPRVLTTWPVMRMTALDAMIGGWVALAGALVASAVGREAAGPRLFAMAGCLAIALGGPLMLFLLSVENGALLWRGPLLGVPALSEGGSAPPTAHQWREIGVIWIAAIAAWIAVAAWHVFSSVRTVERHANGLNAQF